MTVTVIPIIVRAFRKIPKIRAKRMGDFAIRGKSETIQTKKALLRSTGKLQRVLESRIEMLSFGLQ